MWWYMDPLDADGEAPLLDGDAVDVRTLPDCGGFLLEVSFLVGRKLLSGFTLPSCYRRTGYLRADVFMTASYDPPPEAGPEWYRSPGRCELPSERPPALSLTALDSIESRGRPLSSARRAATASRVRRGPAVRKQATAGCPKSQ